MGGYGATLMGERHPDLFGDIVSLSGVTDLENPYIRAGMLNTGIPLDRYAAPLHVNRIWGDPVRHASTWHTENPTAQVCGLRRAWLWFSSGDGVPSRGDLSPFVALSAQTETAVRAANHDFAKALDRVGLRFTYRSRHGVHATTYWIDDMTHVLPTLMHRLAIAAPSPQPAHTRCG
jgi:S-formylglutathione hydrolase FrmB